MKTPINTLISVQNVSKTYGKGDAVFSALDNINFSIVAGETVAIVGKSGSGKSTLMHSLALLDKPTEGSIFIEDKDASHMKSKVSNNLRNQQFGFIFQQFFLNEKDTVLSNVLLPLKIGKVGRKERNERGMKALAAVELEDKAKSKAGTLSGGQKQRVCIARALINGPSIIFADEPTGNLDSHTGKVVEDILFNLNKEQGITLIIVTHDADLAARCGRKLYIKDGRLVNKGDL